MPSLITPVILSGGSGTRLWPLSVPERPKQFIPLLSDDTCLLKHWQGYQTVHVFARH